MREERKQEVVAEMSAYTPPKLRQIIAEAIFRRKPVVLSTVAIVCTVAAAATFLMHRKYEARAKLLVQNVRSAAQLTTNSVDHLVSQGDVSPAEINTEVDLLESSGVAQRALGLSIRDDLRSREQERAVDRFERRLGVEAVHQTDVIDLTMLANSPADARRDLQHLIDAYFEERAGTARNSGAAGFFAAQLEDKSRQLEADQAALTAFQLQHGIADLDDETKLQVTRLSALQSELAAAEASLAAQRSRKATEEGELATTPARSETQVRTITNQYSQERMNTSLVDLQNRRIELLKRYVPTDRQVIEVDDKIATTRKAINEASAHPASEQATDVNPVWVQLSTQIAASGSEISGLQGQCDALGRQISDAQRRLEELEQAAGSYGELRRKLQQSQVDYALYAQRRDEARISEALDHQKLFNVAVLQEPSASLEPVRPKPLLYLSSAFLFAVLLGVALAIYADLAGGQVHTPAQLDAWTGTRTLATFADEAAGGGALAANARQYRRVLFAVRQNVANAALYPSQSSSVTPGALGAKPALPAEGGFRGACVGFTSALQGEGVSFLVAHLATEAARQGSSRVAVLDVRALLERFEVNGGVQLPMRFQQGADHWVLATELWDEDAGASRRSGVHSHFSYRLQAVLEQARREYDLVLLDCPSLQTSTLAGELAPCVDGYVAVVKAGAARRQNIEDLGAQLASTQVPLFGHVLNRRIYPVPRWLHRVI
ncbi:MAG TPA: hypothetical protein VKV02_08775 [Acidobacteriaceae bacterium]|nr:hypothetical protein [Acidobacteriaceae bacterium]